MNIELQAHKETDEALERLEYRIKKVYKQAQEEASKKLNDYLKKFSEQDIKKQEQLKAGNITQAQYEQWRLNKIATGDLWKAKRDNLVQDYVNADKITAQITNEEMPNVYALNHNYASYALEKGANMNLNFTLYDKKSVEKLLKEDKNLLPLKDVDGEGYTTKVTRWNTQKIQSAITQGVLQGDSIPHIADRLQQVTEMNRNSAIRNARTAMTSAENAGRVDTYKEAASKGLSIKKRWLATLDNRTRDAHRELDGQIADNDKPFHSELGDIMYPGDTNADPANVYNCRCTLVAEIAGIKDVEPVYRRDNISGELIKNMSYKEWSTAKNGGKNN